MILYYNVKYNLFYLYTLEDNLICYMFLNKNERIFSVVVLKWYYHFGKVLNILNGIIVLLNATFQ